MLEEIVVKTQDQPGTLAEVGELLGKSGVNIETLAASSALGTGIVHIVVDDGDDAAETLRSHGYEVISSRAVMTATLDDTPGALGQYCRRLADAGVEISAAYMAKRAGGESELIFAVDDLDAALGA